MLWQVGRLLCMEVKQLAGWNIRRVRQERGLTIEALAHQAHVSAAWLGEEFRNGQAPAASAAGLIQRRYRHPPVSGRTKRSTRPALPQRCASNTLGLSRSADCTPAER
jgi:transcriptional regulator with XRE-family HTH domain